MDEKPAVASSPPNLLVRLLAKAIDGIIVLILIELLNTPGFLGGLLYILIADGLFEGKSIGKYLTHLKVTTAEGLPVKTRESVLRNSPLFFAMLISKIPIFGPFVAGIIILFETVMIIGSPSGRRLGDELAGTQVLEN